MTGELKSDLSKTFKNILYFSIILQFSLSIAVFAFSYIVLSIQEKNVVDPYSARIYNRGLKYVYLSIAVFLFLVYSSKFIFCCTKKLTLNFVIALIIITIEAVCEALFFSQTACFKDNDQTYTIIRILFAITTMSINIGINNFLYSKHKSPCTSKCLVTSISLINVLSTAMIVLNVILLANIKKHSLPIHIKLGFFNSTEIAQIESGVYAKDELYKDRVIASLEQVLYGQNKFFAYSDENQNYYYDYYYIVFTTNLYCNSENSKFYKDCQNCTQLKIKVQYIDDGISIPRYNCARVQNHQVVNDCPNLANSYSLVLIQEEQDTVSVAWKSIANCNQIPTLHIDRDPDIYLSR